MTAKVSPAVSPAVWSEGWLGMTAPGVPLWRQVTAGDVDAAAVAAGVDVVMVYGRPWPMRDGWTVTGGGDDGIPVWRVCTARGVSVVFVDVDGQRHAGPWFGLNPRDLLAALIVFERLTGTPWRDSIGRTAETLILDAHPRERGGVLLDREPVTPEPARGSTLELAWQSWQRDLTAPEREHTDAGGVVHGFDANAQYLAAWQTVMLGHGDPVHVTAPGFNPKVAGVWRVLPGELPLWDVLPSLLPAPWLEGREWFTTPTVERIAEVAGDLPRIAEAWVWPKRSAFLRAPAERLRDARASARGVVGVARDVLTTAAADVDIEAIESSLHRAVIGECVLDAIKSLYRVQTGRFGMGGRAETSGFARPDWGHTIRAQARVNLHRRLSRLTARPFAIATDGLLFVGPAGEYPAEFAARVGLPLGSGLGQYRVTGSRHAADVVELRHVGRMFRAVSHG